MPFDAQWVISDPPAVSPYSPPPPLPPVIGAALPCQGIFYTQDYLLRVIDRAYPADYIFTIKAKRNGGYELFQAAAKVEERVSLAISRMQCCAFVLSAEGGEFATGTVEFYREDAAIGAITFRAGTRLSTSIGGRDFITQADAVFGVGDLGPHTVAVRAAAFGYEYNVPGTVITAAGEVLPGEISVIKRAIAVDASNAAAIDPNMKVRQLAPTQGGRDACLDGLGNDLGIPRQTGETDAQYRLRILETPDTVSPGAIQRGVDKLLTPLGSAACLREVGTAKLPGFFYDAGASTDATQVPANNYAYDFDFAVRPQDRFKLYLDYTDMRAFFLVGVPRLVDLSFGLVYDTSSADPFPIQNAYDTTAAAAPNAAYDGFTRLNAAVYKSIYAMVDAKRAAGVRFDLYIEDVGCF